MCGVNLKPESSRGAICVCVCVWWLAEVREYVEIEKGGAEENPKYNIILRNLSIYVKNAEFLDC